jgi:hypothetical protein
MPSIYICHFPGVSLCQCLFVFVMLDRDKTRIGCKCLRQGLAQEPEEGKLKGTGQSRGTEWRDQNVQTCILSLAFHKTLLDEILSDNI